MKKTLLSPQRLLASMPLECKRLFSKSEQENLAQGDFFKIYPEPKISSNQGVKGQNLAICFPHLFLQATRVGIPTKIEVFRDGFLLQEKGVSLNSIEQNLIVSDIFPADNQHDYIVRIKGLTGKTLVTSHPAVVYHEVGKVENQVKVEWVGGKISFGSDLLEFVRKKGLEKLVYVVKENPFEPGKIEKVVLRVDNVSLEVGTVQIYGVGSTGEALGPISAGLQNPFVLIKHDASFSSNTFIWDDALVTWFSLDLEPQIAKDTLDFWYSLQLKKGRYKGLIPREIRTRNYPLVRQNQAILEEEINPVSFHPLSSDQVSGPFILSRVELELFRKTGDKIRLSQVLPNLVSYFEWIEKNRKSPKDIAGKECPVYRTSNLGSGMDNSPRGGGNENWANFSEYGWFDLAAQQAALAHDLANIAKITGEDKIQSEFDSKYKGLKVAINECYWDSQKNLWFDINPNGSLDTEAQTAAFVWGLYAGLADEKKAKAIVSGWIKSPDKFGDYPPLPSLARDHPLFNPDGDYWLGGAWPSIWWHALVGLEESGAQKTAHELALLIHKTMNEVFEKEGTVFEFYAPITDANGLARPGIREDRKARSEFLGWGKIPGILVSELIFGFKPEEEILIWNFYRPFVKMEISNFYYMGGTIKARILNFERDWVEVEVSTETQTSVIPRLILEDFSFRSANKINLSPGSNKLRIIFQ